EGIVHGPRGVVLRGVQGREVVPVGFNFGALGHRKTHRTENVLHALERERDRVQAPFPTAASWQGHIQFFRLQLSRQFGVGQRLTAGVERRFHLLLGLVDGGATGFLVLGTECGHALEQVGQAAGLAQETRFRILKVGGRRCGDKGFGSRLHQCVEIVHLRVSKKKAGTRGQAFVKSTARETNPWTGVGWIDRRSIKPPGVSTVCWSGLCSQAASLDLAISTRPAKAAGSWMAMSDRTLRSSSISAFLMPAMNRL